jgi:chromosome segregation ATPase
MSQAGFGDSSAQERISPLMPEPQTPLQSVSSNIHGEPTTLFNALPRQVLEQELQFCNERSQQAQVLLRQAQEQLQLSQLVIQRQETLTQTLQSRIDQLESELQDVHTNCDELRDRLKRQQHHTSQLKAALERCLDTSTPAPNDMALSALESW